jgi:hypothetical protein
MQAVRVEVIHDPYERPVLFVNNRLFLGTPENSGGVLTSWLVPLARGPMRLKVTDRLLPGAAAETAAHGAKADLPADGSALRHIQVK